MKRAIIALALSVVATGAMAESQPSQDSVSILTCGDVTLTLVESNHQHMLFDKAHKSVYVGTSGFTFSDSDIIGFAPLDKNGQVMTGRSGLSLAASESNVMLMVGSKQIACNVEQAKGM